MDYNGINLDINDNKDLAQYTEIDKNIIAGGCTSIKGILQSVAIANLKENDTAKVDTYKNKFDRPGGEVKVLTRTGDGINIFMDNLTVKCVSHKCHLFKENDDGEEREKTKSKDTGIYNSSIRRFFDNNVNTPESIGVKSIETRAEPNLPEEEKNRYNELFLGGLENVSNEYSYIKYKISTSEINLNAIYNGFTENKIKQGLNNSGIYIFDYDLTVDVLGCIDKHKFIDYLMFKHNYTIGEGQKHKNIILNDNTVSLTCLSFWLENETGFLRVKFYDKFKQSIESGGVRVGVGSHLGNWINNPGKKLRNTIKNSLEGGLLRIEISYGLEHTKIKTPPTLETVKKDMDYLKSLLEEAPNDAYFYCKIEDQYKAIIDKLINNVIIYDITTKTLLFCRWFNSFTNKINGFYNFKTNKTEFINILKHFTFNRPFKLILTEEFVEKVSTGELYSRGDKKGQLKPDKLIKKIKINQNIYKKEGLKVIEDTVLTDSGNWETLNDNGKNIRDNAPEDMGIVAHNGIKFIIAGKKEVSIKEKDIYFNRVEHATSLNIIGKKRELKLQEQEILNKETSDELNTLRQQAAVSFNKFIQAQEAKEQQDIAEKLYIKKLNLWDGLEKLTDYEIGTVITVDAFKKYSNVQQGNFLIYDEEKDIKLYANLQLSSYLNKCLNNNINYFKQLRGDVFYLYRDNAPRYTLTIKIIDIVTVNNKKKANLIINCNPLIYKKEEEQITNYNILKYRDEELLTFKHVRKTFINVKTLNEGDEYYIYSIHKVKDSYIFKMLDANLKPIENIIYTGNYYVNRNEDIKNIYENNIQTQPIKIKIAKPRTTPTNNKDIYIFVIVNNEVNE